jgi:prefoldin alpha subunit
MMASEEELRELAANFELYRNQLEQTVRQEETVRASLEENLRTKETLNRLRQCSEDAETLIPIGANVFVYCKLGDREKVLVGIGAEVAVENSIDEALERLEERIKELTDAKEQIDKKVTELDSKVTEVSTKLQQAYEESRGGLPLKT